MISYKIAAVEGFDEFHGDYFPNLLELIQERGFLSSSIEEIIITDDFVGEIKRQSVGRFLQPNVTKDREYKAISKTVDFNGKKKIFFDAIHVNRLIKYTPQIFTEQIIEIYAEDFIIKRYHAPDAFGSETPFTEIVKIYFTQWSTKYYASLAEKIVGVQKEFRHTDVKMFVDAFKRKMKKLHYKYQSDSDLNFFWIQSLFQVDSFIRRCQDVKYDDGNFENLQEFSEILALLDEIEILTELLIEEKELCFFKLRSLVLKILNKCFIDIPSENPQQVKITDTPKRLFKNNLVDSEPRIVAFIDILGFKKIISEYESDQYSNILMELHDSLDRAVADSIDRIKDVQKQSELKEFLEYKMFSDCICISLPYIEHGNDFHIQFQSISMIVKNYQLIMMQKGFYVRGGISIGDFYSDKNMIFSGALVSAYELEQNARNSIVLVDKCVLERLEKNFSENSSGLFLEESLIYSLTEPTKVFVNPFDFIDKSLKYINYLTTDENENTDVRDSGEIDNTLNSLLKLSKEMLKKSLEYIPSPKEAAVEIKVEILKIINMKIEKFEKEAVETEDVEVIKIIMKHLHLKSFVQWSLDNSTQNTFAFYQFRCT